MDVINVELIFVARFIFFVFLNKIEMIGTVCKIIGTLLDDIGLRRTILLLTFFLLLEVSRKRLSWSPISQEVITEKSFASNW